MLQALHREIATTKKLFKSHYLSDIFNTIIIFLFFTYALILRTAKSIPNVNIRITKCTQTHQKQNERNRPRRSARKRIMSSIYVHILHCGKNTIIVPEKFLCLYRHCDFINQRKHSCHCRCTSNQLPFLCAIFTQFLLLYVGFNL